MNVHPPGQHSPSCGGPSDCAEYASLGRMSPNEFIEWLKQDRARYAAVAPAARRRVAVLRHAIDSARYAPPNPYTKGLDALRADLLTDRDRAAITRTADPRPATDYTPPNPYAAGLALLRLQEQDAKENRR